MGRRSGFEIFVIVVLSAGLAGLLGYSKGWTAGVDDRPSPDSDVCLAPVVVVDPPAGPGWVQLGAYEEATEERDRAEHVLACVRTWAPRDSGPYVREDLELFRDCGVRTGRPRGP